MQFSIIVPVYNRPQELAELLASLRGQDYKGKFEVVVVEDGSTERCEAECAPYMGEGAPFEVRYFYKENGGPGPARNYGAERAKGEYLLILDSDVVLPKGYLQAVADELKREYADAFGGPDCAHKDFTAIQKAISYSMTSFFTTGGIRGGKKKMDKFYPRSFNLGIRKDVFAALGGFAPMRFGEDIDLSIRIFKGGYKCRLFPEAWVWHKRRATFRQFFKQVHNSGIARIVLYKKYPESLKVVHLLPAVFTLGVGTLTIGLVVGLIGMACAMGFGIGGEKMWGGLIVTAVGLMGLYSLLIGIDAAWQNRKAEKAARNEGEDSVKTRESSVKIGCLSVAAAYVQLIGYGSGFLRAVYRCLIRKEADFQAFRKNFYK